MFPYFIKKLRKYCMSADRQGQSLCGFLNHNTSSYAFDDLITRGQSL